MIKVIAELGINHNGSLDIAKKMIDVAYTAGCDYVKFQKRTIESCYTKKELDTPRESPWGTTTREQKWGLEIPVKDYKIIDEYCKPRIPWFASPWDIKSIFILSLFSTPFIKVPSARLTNDSFLEVLRDQTYAPIILSTGMSTISMIDHAVDILGKERIYCIMHCTSTYPTATNELNLKVITDFKQRYPWTKIGFSNHHPGVVFMPAAVALGAEMIEFHLTLDKTMYGSDQAASFNPEGAHKVLKYIRDIETALGTGNKQIYDSERSIIDKLRK